ncbi:MAG: CPBP family intramembrane metalloprotease [Lachnospiraceae bacterium]|nr:CPBP family intramembrane metalloprotease [Lachnospiraceae bacterium]
MKRVRALEANRVFLVSVIFSQAMLYLVAGLGVRDRMVLQILVQLFIAFPAVACLYLQRLSLKEGLLLNTIGWKEGLLLIPLAVCINKLAEFINTFSQLFTVNTIGESMAELILSYPFPFAFFTIAVVPAVCEEVLCRGMLFWGYRKCGRWVAILLTAFLFGILHMNPNQFFYAFALGIIFALVNDITGSIFPSVLLHMYVNGRSVVMLYLTVKGNEELLQEQVQPDAAMIGAHLLGNLPWTIAAVAGTVLILFLLLKCKEKRVQERVSLFCKEEIEPKEERGGFGTVYSPALIAGVFICVVYMILRAGN